MIIDSKSLLDEAERRFLVEGCEEVFFPIRRRSSVTDFYERLELELREQEIITIAEYRLVKEEFVRVSRPATLKVSRHRLFALRPYLSLLQSELLEWKNRFDTELVNLVLKSAYTDAIRDPALTRSCFEVFAYLLSHRDQIQGLMARQVQHANSSKLIGYESLLLKIFSLWRGEAAGWPDFFIYFGLSKRAVDFRFYAPFCNYDRARIRGLHALVSSDWVSRYDFSPLAGTLIVENLETFICEASLSTNHLILWGSGWRVAALRSFHTSLPRPISYWGDLDKEGYEIFGYLKEQISDLQPTLMDAATLERYRAYSIEKPPFYGPFKQICGLQEVYQNICENGLCIEQEKIHEAPYRR